MSAIAGGMAKNKQCGIYHERRKAQKALGKNYKGIVIEDGKKLFVR